MVQRAGQFTRRGNFSFSAGQHRGCDNGLQRGRRVVLPSKLASRLCKVSGAFARRSFAWCLAQIVVRWMWYDLSQRQQGWRSGWHALAANAWFLGLALGISFTLLVVGSGALGLPLPWEVWP